MTVDDLKDRVTLLRKIETVDDELNRIVTWQDIQDVWAKVEAKARYISKSNSTKQELTYNITIRKNEGFDAVRVAGQVMVLQIPPYSDKVFTYIQGAVLYALQGQS